MQVQEIPRERTLDSTLAQMAKPYDFIGERCRQLGSSVFQTRLLGGQRFLCLSGVAAAEVFYDERRFTRERAAPGLVKKTLFGDGGRRPLPGLTTSTASSCLCR